MNAESLFSKYIQTVSLKFSHKETSEMGYRSDFENLLKDLFESINVRRIDHDAKAQKGNKPDFVVLNHDIPILYIEAKDIGVSLDKVEKSEQMTRYFGYANLVLTDYLEFRFYRNGVAYEEPIKIANFDLKNRIITALPENYTRAGKTLLDFAQSHKEPIRSGKHLSKIMGGKARRIRDNARQFLASESSGNAELARVYQAVRKLLVHDLTTDAFADMYAQTLVYGLFVARFHDETDKDFSRQEARDLIPASNPFLRHFFDHIVGPNFDKRLEYIVNELCEVFSHANVKELMSQYFKDDLWGETHEGPDPVIHFYEDFLKEYDPDLRKKLGAFYTPIAVVRFIVNSVDHVLKKDFGLSAGLADSTKTKQGIHKVQILDPAVGTGTFISATIREIYTYLLKNGQKGRWPTYVHNDLLPRLHGFELMMAPYTIAHLKLSMAFKETGFWNFHRRLGIYLTNSLEEGISQDDLFTGFGLAESIADESKEASIVKNEMPIMVVIGNPPYSISSSNKSDWILKLIKDYKKGLAERKINLDDDYIKFIRFAEHFVEKNRTGVVSMITNNSFIDGITHRQMRKHLMETFDEIYILDLHGNSKKKEISPDGSKDENVFDIQQGVAILIFVRKNPDKTDLATVSHSELFGERKSKFERLAKSDLGKVAWTKLSPTEPYYFFVPKNFDLAKEYNEGFGIEELFTEYNSGIQTKRDSLVYHFTENELEAVLRDFRDLDHASFQLKYELEPDPIDPKARADWTIKNAKSDVYKSDGRPVKVLYRPFDQRYTWYSGKTKGFMAYPRAPLMNNLLKENISLVTVRNSRRGNVNNYFVSDGIVDKDAISPFDNSRFFPLYTYPQNGESFRTGDVGAIEVARVPNIDISIARKIADSTGTTYYPTAEFPTKTGDERLTPIEIFDYVYAILNSVNYQEKYKEFLKIDFPRIPYPKDKKTFKKLAEVGTKLRLTHILESAALEKVTTTYEVAGSDIVEKIEYKDERVYINRTQHFGNVPQDVWSFSIGGYQPAQRWLKDRKGRVLLNGEIEHYQKILAALGETKRLVEEIEKIYG